MSDRPELAHEVASTMWHHLMTAECMCSYHDGPEPDCPDHGDTRMFLGDFVSTAWAALCMAQAVDAVRIIGDELLADASEEKRVIGLRILEELAKRVDLTPPQPESFYALSINHKYDDEVPF